jgi:hypothetical protein
MTPAVDYFAQELPYVVDFLAEEEAGRVAYILDREKERTIKEWLRRVKLVPELMRIRLSDKDRTRHLPVLFREVIFRLRFPNYAACHISGTATAHGHRRQAQGYTPAMLIAESRIFEVVTFRTLHLHRSELDQSRLLSDVMVIADEADAQLMGAVRSLTAGVAGTRRGRQTSQLQNAV